MRSIAIALAVVAVTTSLLQGNAFALPSTISTVAGNGRSAYSGDGRAGDKTAVGGPSSVATDSHGNIYIADTNNNRIRKIDSLGVITTIAGGGRGFSGDGGPARRARLSSPLGVRVDPRGNLFIADYGNHRIRRISSSGIMSTVAGNGVGTFTGDGVPATTTGLQFPSGMTADRSGNLYIADAWDNRVRKVGPNGIISTIAGTGRPGYSGDGGPATKATVSPSDVALDAAGNLYIADFSNSRIRMVNRKGIISTVAGKGTAGYAGDGGPATSAQINAPEHIFLDPRGRLYIADALNNRIRRVGKDGIISTIAGNGMAGYSGDGGPALIAELNYPRDAVIDRDGNLYIADAENNRVRKVEPPIGIPAT